MLSHLLEEIQPGNCICSGKVQHTHTHTHACSQSVPAHTLSCLSTGSRPVPGLKTSEDVLKEWVDEVTMRPYALSVVPPLHSQPLHRDWKLHNGDKKKKMSETLQQTQKGNLSLLYTSFCLYPPVTRTNTQQHIFVMDRVMATGLMRPSCHLANGDQLWQLLITPWGLKWLWERLKRNVNVRS